MARTNFLIGNGESLVSNIKASSGPPNKVHPYEYEDRVEALAPIIKQALAEIDEIPADACPDDEAVIAITLHPSYLAKSYHPSGLFRELGLRQVGSHETSVDPMRSTRKEPTHIATELFVAGPRKRLRQLYPKPGVAQSEVFREDFRKFEHIRAPGAERIKEPELVGSSIPLEVVLHIAGDDDGGDRILGRFEEWCSKIGVSVLSDRTVGGLAFVNARSNRRNIDKLAQFSFLRLVRRMPKLSFRPIAMRASPIDESFDIEIVHTTPIANRSRIAVFDGGLESNHPFGSLATLREPIGIGAPLSHGIEHGTQVTSAVLFGPLEEGEPVAQPFTTVDHWRVVDNGGDDFDLTLTLDRIINVLETEDYDAVNLSLGPDMPLEDNDVHIWTASMDAIAARNKTLIISAAGNNGEDDHLSGRNRVQPSADGVNVLAVGALDRLGPGWTRAPYSAIGPGRSPGLIKPDCVAVGGTSIDPFFAFSDHGVASGTMGTSFAAPTVTRLASGIKTTFDQLSPTAIRAVLLHTADQCGLDRNEVGWGSVRHNLAEIVACADDEATVVFQGELGLQSMRRYPIPTPPGGFSKRVTLSATFVVASPIDPEDAVSYTRVGAQIFFRPDTISHPGLNAKGELKLHPTKSFFGNSQQFQTEQELRDDAHRWESVKRATKRFNADTLSAPLFDIQHHARAHGGNGKRDATVPYALIVTIREPDNLTLYNDILNAYSTLRAMVPGIVVPAS